MPAPRVPKRAADLRQKIEKANYEYYILDQPTLDDAAYDALLRELIEIEEAHPELVTPESPTQRVGIAPSTRFAPVQHASPMLSLSNVFDEAELRAFDQRVRQALGRAISSSACGHSASARIRTGGPRRRSTTCSASSRNGRSAGTRSTTAPTAWS